MLSSVAQPAPTDLLDGSPFVGYVYSYPHKTAYRAIEPAVPLPRVWQEEQQDSLFLYLHIPFCEFRCGFCNLFTLSQPGVGLPGRYLEALRRQAESVREALPDARFTRLALGGGTPTFLSLDELRETLAVLTDVMGAEPLNIPVGCEASPATATPDKLRFLREVGVDRLSLGVQSFDDRDCGGIGRPQRREQVEACLAAIREVGFPTLNIDLIYGGEGQTIEAWLASVETALTYLPEELYLYPLYVRPQTGLGRLQHEWDDWRLTAYREARALLLANGYEQVSFRMFRATGAADVGGPVYCCQEDGMIGLGCGARSYTRRLHYASRYAVRNESVRGILADYFGRTHEQFQSVDYGFALDLEDQQRRFVIISLLQAEGVSQPQYRARFGSDLLSDWPQLGDLQQRQLAEISGDSIRLTPAGLERSDVIGPWLFSRKVRDRMESYSWD